MLCFFRPTPFFSSRITPSLHASSIGEPLCLDPQRASQTSQALGLSSLRSLIVSLFLPLSVCACVSVSLSALSLRASLGLWRFLVIVTFQTLALLAAISHLKCAFGDPGAVPRSPLQSSSSSEFAGGSARELQHPGQPSEGRSPQAAADAAAADAAAADPQQQGGRGPFADKCCARRGLLRLYAAVFCPLRVFKNFIGGPQLAASRSSCCCCCSCVEVYLLCCSKQQLLHMGLCMRFCFGAFSGSKRVGSSNTRAEDGLEEGWSPPICRQCAAPKPLRAHHCSGCRRCIIRMDHHCECLCCSCLDTAAAACTPQQQVNLAQRAAACQLCMHAFTSACRPLDQQLRGLPQPEVLHVISALRKFDVLHGLRGVGVSCGDLRGLFLLRLV